ncbi:type-F conjugative transfer system secretin TraK [Piscirickettsia salmonis]|uniref:type-F conjugative transfer system secretin TraK n=1 Tax=Piscirickettsia salmonis TaxID=1238 RepID=UPI0006BCBBE2|nr:type-F conjugative transfer system secretin TraK [Piscirickettsia salmonis]ALA26635.1 conjugal transfer protein TraK [Piscirickettsia salmonis]APS45848.1 hypothetical protein AVI48_15560 [Piscirickettsia salmonis]APS49269.1 hypothetical protein AVI49_16565 [Piscirickettsia salmonis]QGO82344.1 conjugal transfer protein TraK [Piscirickettsia salmonis]QGP24173.1 conjugal transfer protein TraK [Piscirickettsia salmonis]
MFKKTFVVMVGCLCASAWAENSATQIHFNDNSNVSIQASSANINRIFVKGDRIIQRVAPQGTFLFDKRRSKDGSVYFRPLYPKAQFSIFFTTQSGHHFSALVSAVGADGKTVEMIPNNSTEAQVHWEKNTGYLKLLQAFMKGMIKDEEIKGVNSQVLKDSKPFNGFPDTEMTLTKIYQGGQLQGFVYSITNTSNHTVHLPERKFWRPNVRAVSLSELNLAPKHSGFIYTIMSAV